ncbi:hypothetical protein ACTHR6_02205 [Ralstonia holmesii]|uniref:Transmembrane protein n=1 Tax=Ralstonia holmesii TaxID=3058602 RepID=A0ABC8QM41_9RALS|nr:MULTISPECIES: hypothetical protein [Ralstonia]CAJ0697749.1 hypothetical protein R11007_02652 [Ralstonia sp. LMG 32967]CAJ0798267.1 hypothetical protein LMG18096_03524 [Ralstonia sp. LMG 32967]CAJ0807189.1 hypothetical protein LMG18093_00309 [Ralstonia sp. LMG 32967]
MSSPLHRHVRLILGLIWTTAFMLMLAHLLYGEVGSRHQAPRLQQDATVSMSVPSLRPVPI